MPLETLFISGPSGGGKSTVARMIADRAVDRPAHYLRMKRARDDHTNAVREVQVPDDRPAGDDWASVHQVSYTTERVFETLPDGLRAVRRRDLRGFTVIEADIDPALRHAYPYDYRVFVMPAPADLFTVFRTPREAAAALQQVMQDTSTFATEIFGLFDAAGLDDTAGVEHLGPRPGASRDEAIENLDVGESQIHQFLGSPIGAEIASRIQLEPDYHALVESDVVVINTGAGSTDGLEPCVQRLEKLLGRLRQDARRHSVLYWGDIRDHHDPAHDRLIKRLQTLFSI